MIVTIIREHIMLRRIKTMDSIIKKNTFSLNLVSSCSSRFAGFPLRFAVRSVVYTSEFISDYHYHDFPQVWYCKQGTYRHLVNGVSKIYNSGSFLIIPPGVSHGYEIFADCETTLICLEGSFSFFRTLQEPCKTSAITHLFLCRFPEASAQTLKTIINFSGSEKEKLDDLLLKLCSFSYTEIPDNITKITSLINELFALPSFKLKSENLKRYQTLIKTKLSSLILVCAYLQKNYSSKIHCQELIKISTLCQSDFFKYFKLLTGTTYSIYLQMIRVRHAHYLCCFSSYTFNYISDKCGFGNITYMEKLLQKYFKLSAGQIRKISKTCLLLEKDKHISQDYFFCNPEIF